MIEILAGDGCTTASGAFMSGRIAAAAWADPDTLQLVAESYDMGPVGDYCYTGSYSEDGRCPEEANGVLLLEGDVHVTVTSDGWEDCDQCGMAAIEGVDVGEVCGLFDPP